MDCRNNRRKSESWMTCAMASGINALRFDGRQDLLLHNIDAHNGTSPAESSNTSADRLTESTSTSTAFCSRSPRSG